MKKYEVSREIYNPCAEVYIFDNNFFREIETDNIEKTISEWIGRELPNFEKNTFSGWIHRIYIGFTTKSKIYV